MVRNHRRPRWPLELLSLVVLTALLGATACGSSPDPNGIVDPPSGLHARAWQIDHYLVNYGAWPSDAVDVAHRHQLVIVNPSRADLHRQDVAGIQAGADPNDPSDDVLVLCYVSVGEDLRTASLSDAQVSVDPRFRGDGTGPRVDPRGPNAAGQPLTNIDPKGKPSGGGTGFASYYLDDDSVYDSPVRMGDGFPDRNPLFGSLFVNAGDPAWFDEIDGMKIDSSDGLVGLREALTSGYGRGLACDGVFLDTIDTAAPNSYTNPASANETKFEWTAPGFGAFIRKVHSTYPDKLILQNRGLFFFDPRHGAYAYNARGAIDFVLFESYRLDSNDAELWDPTFYADNQFNIAPKLMAEANRPDGFRVLSLGYAEGPSDQMSPLTLSGQSTLGTADLLEDIRVTQQVAGFRHYLTDAKVDLVNDFVLTHDDLEDHDPPQWTSTYNDHPSLPAVAPTPRVGIQQAVADGGTVTVRWDVALDENRVQYVLYAQPQPFDFAADPALSAATRMVLTPAVPSSYVAGVGPDSYPYEASISSFPRGQMQYLVIRAVDQSANANEDTNTVVLSVTP
jgi:hypothetical protein